MTRSCVFFIFALFIFAGAIPAHAAIVEQAPIFDGFFDNNPTIGGGAVLPLTRFRLSQATGSETLTKVGVTLVASSTMANGSVSRLSLWKESGTKPGFQIDSDTFVTGAASTTVTTGLLVVLEPDSETPTVTGTEYYIIASTTAASGLTNGHGFNVQMDTNYASTSALTGVGTAFLSDRKVSLNQGATLKISEIKIGTALSGADEFIELYNSGEADINLADLPLSVHSFYASGSSTPGISLTYYKKIIPSHGYFLIANQFGYSGSAQPDAVMATSTSSILLANGGLSIATSTLANQATSTAIDLVGWGTQPIANCENNADEGSVTPCVATLLENSSSIERNSTGYPFSATSTADTLAPGGVDSTKGNGFDKNFNKTDFVLQTVPNPQNSLSPIEFPFGGGGEDISTLQVEGSYPSNGQTSVSPDIQFFGFNLSKPVNAETIWSVTATTTVTLFQVDASTNGPTGSNLCTSVLYNPSPSSFEPQVKCILTPITAGSPNTLLSSNSYVFTVTNAVRDLSGNSLDQDAFTGGNQNYVATSTTGGAGQTTTNITPPAVVGVSPFNGSQNAPTNLAKIQIEFNQASMDTTTFTSANITLSGGETLSNFSFATSTGKNVLTVDTDGSLTANTKYTLTIGTGVKTSQGIGFTASPTYSFTTGSGSDTTAPVVIGVLPTNATTIAANTSDFVIIFDDAIDTSTATSGAVTLGITGGSNLPGAVRYDPVSKEAHFIPNNILPVGVSLTLTLKGASLKNTSGVYLGTNITKTWTVEASNTDTTPPAVLFANIDEFSVAITFNEAVNSTDATNLSNYSLLVGGVTQTPSALAGHSITYDASTRTAKLTGLRLTPGASVTASVSNIKDISGNIMTSAATSLSTVNSSTGSGGTGGFVGPGSFTGTFGETKDFSASGIGFMPPVNIRPSSSFINASSTYAFELPLTKQINAGGTIVITFPSSSDFGLCCIATTSTKNPFLAQQNSDINGPGAGTIGIKTVTANAGPKTITLTLDTATRSESGDAHDFLSFSLADMKNPSIPKGIDSSGYSLDIKSKSSSGLLLESFNANPVYIGGGSQGGGATTQIRGTVTGDSGNLEGVLIHLMSPQTGPQDATTASDGTYSFTDIPVGSQFLTNNFGGGSEYYLFTDPFVDPTNTATDFFGNTMPTPVQATSTSLITRDFDLTPTSAAINFTVNLSAAASTFTTAETVDVFAGGPGQFIVRTITPGTATLTNSNLTTIPIPQVNGFWGIGIGPAMPKGTGGGFSGPPPAPNWSAPRPIEVTVSGCPSACATTVGGTATTSNNFTITTADKTIAGVLKDGSGNAVANAMVFAYSGANGNGNHAQTSTTGVFQVKVVEGSYIVGAFVPGMGKSKEIPVVVASNGDVFVNGSQTASASFTLIMTKPSYTITGQVTDGTNAIGNASVFAYQTNGFGHADAITDSSTGNYTMYVDSGTWKVSSFIPGFGPMAEQTVIVAGANQSDINFAPASNANFSLYTGNIYDDANNDNIFATSTEGLVGAVIRLSGTNGVNEGVSGAQGAFSVRVPAGSGYTLTDIFMPGYGRIAPLDNSGANIGTLNLTASSTNNYIRVPKRNTITVNIKDSDGNLVVVPKAFIDLFNTTTKQGSHVELTNASSTTILVATGTSPTIRAFVQGVPPANISVASDGAGTSVTSGIVTVDNTTEAVKVVLNTATASLSTIQGSVYHTAAESGNELADAWIQFIDDTNGVSFGTQATSSGGYSVKAANGTYSVIVAKSGYVGPTQTLTITGDTTENFILSPASQTISGTVTAGGSSASNAFVRAEKVGGGQAITQTNTSGAFTLNVTGGSWKVFAAADGYAEGAAAGNPIASGTTGVTVALTTTVSLQSKLATSNTFTDTSAGTFSDSTVGVNVELDSNSLGAAGNSSYITAKETSNFPNTASVNIVANKAKDISAFSGGSQIKNLQSGKTATIDLTYTKAELAETSIDTTTEVANLKVVVYSEDKQEWESLSTVATYLATDGTTVASPASDLSDVATIKFTAVSTHFSTYALSAATGSVPPGTPSGITATAGAGVGSAIALAWSASSGAEGYYVYRDTSPAGTFALLATISGGSTVSYSDSQVSGGTTYYYKISAYKSSGSSESAASSAVNAASAAAAGGGAPGGGGGGGSAPAPRAQKIYPDGTVVYLDDLDATAKIKELDAKFAKTASATAVIVAEAKSEGEIPATVVAQASATAQSVSPVFTRVLKRGQSHVDVKRLQQILNADPDTRIAESGVGSPGSETNFFGTLTMKAVQRFQAKYRIVSSGTPETTGYGLIGPSTRAKLAEVFEKVKNSTSPETPITTTSIETTKIAGTGPIVTRQLSRGSRGADVKALQEFLGVSATGYFGPLTMKAVQVFQEEQGVASPGEPGFGEVGPKTRATLQKAGKTVSADEALSDTTPASETSAEVVVSAKEALEVRVQDAMVQLKSLQELLKELQKEQ